MKLHNDDCLTILSGLEENSIDAIVSDPPYELGFMGKKWDASGIAYNVELWKECLRVLKPGGHLLSFGGTRTYHKMAVAIEDAGFEIRDMLEWIYASGFPKSHNIGVAYNKLEQKEWSKIGKAFDSSKKSVIFDVWKNNSNNVKFVETQSEKSRTEAGINIPKKDFAVLNVGIKDNQINSNLLVSFVGKNLNEAQATDIKESIAQKNANIIITELNLLSSPVKFVGKSQPKENRNAMNIFTAQCDVKEWLKENTMVSLKADEALKTLRGNKKYSREEITNVLCAVLTDILKLTILNQSKTFRNLDTTMKMECVSAINVIITEYTTECLISNTVDILKSKAYDKKMGNEREEVWADRYHDGGNRKEMGDKHHNRNVSFGCNANTNYTTKGNSPWEGFGSALKPAHESICMARKPLSEKTIVENCIKHGTGALDIDGCRIPTQPRTTHKGRNYTGNKKGDFLGEGLGGFEADIPQGRFPANLLVTDDALNDGEMTKSKQNNRGLQHSSRHGGLADIGGNIKEGTDTIRGHNDSGSKSRFFNIDVWAEKHGLINVPKASKKERNRGCEGLDEKQTGHGNLQSSKGMERFDTYNRNHHPTCKPIHLMSWLIRLVSKPGDVVLDPFAGSGTTGVACKALNREFIGIEKDEEYFKIANARCSG